MIIFFIILSLLFIFLFVLIVNSPGELRPLLSKDGAPYPNGLSEKIKLVIGGTEQGSFIRSENTDNPVLLFLHGGPGSPELPIIYTDDSYRLEKEFTVCYWDQRGAGMSMKHTPESSMTLEQLIADTLEMTDYLKKRFNQKKIFLMGHSWGSYLGAKTVAQAPEHFLAYIGMGQLSHQTLSERLAYDYLLNHATKIQDKKILKDLAKVDPDASSFPSTRYVMGVRSSAMNKYGVGITHDTFSTMTLLKQVILFKGYHLKEKLDFFRGSLFSLKHLFHYTTAEDLNLTTRHFNLPIYVTHGKYDLQVSYELAREYVQGISAPRKEFIAFEESAHTPIIEEREKFLEVLQKIKADCLD